MLSQTTIEYSFYIELQHFKLIVYTEFLHVLDIDCIL